MMTRSIPLTLACSLTALFASACSDDGATPAAGTTAADDDGGDGSPTTLPPTTMSAGDDGGTMSPTSGAEDDASTGATGPIDGTGLEDATGEPADTGSSGAMDSSTGEPADDDTLYEIQDGTIPERTMVTVNGIIVTGIAPNGVFAEEPAGGQYSGIFLFSNTAMGGPDLTTLALGDEIDVVGETSEFNGMTEIVLTAGSLAVVDSGVALPGPDAITAADIVDEATGEPWEAVLVRVEADLTVTDADPEGQPNVNEFLVSDGTDDMLVDDFLYDIVDDGAAAFPGFGVDASFTAIQGPVNFSFGNHKVAPREAADLEGYAAP